jgi:hypothetical protein
MSQDHLLKDTGLLQAYSELVGDLMSQGTPEGDVFEYSARFILEQEACRLQGKGWM